MNRRKILIRLIPMWVLFMALQGTLWSQNCEIAPCAQLPNGNGPDPCSSKLYCTNNGNVLNGFITCSTAADTDGCGIDASDAAVPLANSDTEELLLNIGNPDCFTSGWNVQWIRFMTPVNVNQFDIQGVGGRLSAYAIFHRSGWDFDSDNQADAADLCNDPTIDFKLVGSCTTVNQWTPFTNLSADLTEENLYYIAMIYENTGNGTINFKVKECDVNDTGNCEPTIACPDTITVQCNNTDAIEAWLLTAGGNNCGAEFSISNNDFLNTDFDDCSDVGDKTATFTLLDNNGVAVQVNNADVNCTVTVTTTACQPSINCPADLTIQCDDLAARDNWLLAAIGDDCGVGVTVVNNDFDVDDFEGCTTLQDYEVIFSLDADAGVNCMSTLTTINTSIACLPPNVQYTLSADDCKYTVTPLDVITPGSNPVGVTIMLFYDEAMTMLVPTSPELTVAEIDTTIYIKAINPSGLSCWTSTNAVEDKTPPVLDCPCGDTYTSSLLGLNGPTFFRPDGNCTEDATGAPHAYDAIELTIETDGQYTFTMDEVANFNGYALLYSEFDPDAPCDNLIIVDDNSATGSNEPEIVFNATMSPGTYTLVTTHTGNGPKEFDFTWTFVGPGTVIQEQCLFTCTQADSILNGLIAGPLPIIGDACDMNVDTLISDLLINGIGCSADTIRRTVTVTDDSNNASSCTYDLLLRKPTADDIDFPENINLACDAGFATDQFGAPSPDVTGYPTAFGVPIISGGVCNVFATYNDEIVIDPFECNGQVKYLRKWTIINCCPDPNISLMMFQTIKVMDENAPVITGVPTDTVQIGTQATVCSGIYILPDFAASDNCDGGVIDVVVTSAAGTINNAETAIFDLPLGCTEITVTATDDCGNETIETYIVEVSDDDPPVMNCETLRTIGLSTGDASFADAISFDDESTDNCGIVSFSVRRMDNPNCDGDDSTPFGEDVPFFCCDVGGPNVMVELQAVDAAGNTNSCMVEVEVQDKLAPAITCPSDKFIDCDMDFTDLSLTGTATGVDNCGPLTFSSTDAGALDMCNEGVITRTWTVTDASGNKDSCMQVITVENMDPFNLDEDVIYPESVNIDCTESTDTSNTGTPTITSNSCDMVFYLLAEEIEVPTSESQVVKKILRTWEIYDWCASMDGAVDADLQVIKVMDTNAPTFDCPSDVTISGGLNLNLEVTNIADNCTDSAAIDVTYIITGTGLSGTGPVIDLPTGSGTDLPTGNYEVIVEFKDAVGNTSQCVVDVEVSSAISCDVINTNVLYQADVGGQNGEIDVLATDASLYVNINLIGNPQISRDGNNFGDFITFSCSDIISGNETPINVLIEIDDGVGGRLQCDKVITVVDNFSPSASCKTIQNAPTINLDAGASAVFFADDINLINNNSFDQCTSSDNLTFSFNPEFVDCSLLQVAATNFLVETIIMTVADEFGNTAACSTDVKVQSFDPLCAPQPPSNTNSSVAGLIENEEGAQVEYVHVEATGGNISEEVMTSETGDYNFSLVNNDNYVITPERNDDPLNGVSTLDLIKINQHILQIETLGSPYKVIAADINRSGEVTTFDLVSLRKLILHIDTEFADNTSWRFVDADFVFPDPADPFATDFPEVYTINGLAGDMVADFVAVKVGDVNCSASANDLHNGGDDRSATTPVLLQVEEQVLQAGEVYTIDFNLEELTDLEGYQFTLHFDQSALAFDEVKTGDLPGLTTNNFGTQMLDRGVLTASWHTNEAINVDKAIAFSLSFTARTDVALSEVLSMSSTYTKAEAYTNGEITPVDLAFETNQGLITKQFQLFQNRPNPFKGETVISFQLPEAQEGSMKIYDLTGRIIKTVQGQFNAGYNEIVLSQADLAGQGVYYYQLEVADHAAMRKMILLE